MRMVLCGKQGSGIDTITKILRDVFVVDLFEEDSKWSGSLSFHTTTNDCSDEELSRSFYIYLPDSLRYVHLTLSLGEKEAQKIIERDPEDLRDIWSHHNHVVFNYGITPFEVARSILATVC